MRTNPRPEVVRQLVEETFESFAPGWLEIEENLLIDHGKYIARSYRSDAYMAMWLVEVGIVQFYDAEGEMLATINLFESYRPQRMAA
jgi:hypothetical protein